jgi:AcrR family transcriptional regulator
MDLFDDKYMRYRILGKDYALPYLSGNKTKERILMVSTIMFAEKGYEAVSVRDIADAIGIKGGSIYNHFKNKEELWNAVLDHAVALYDLYFKGLEAALEKARSIEEVLEVFYVEPKRLVNIFTCFAFSLLFTDQFRDIRAGVMFNERFIGFGTRFIKKWLDRCVEREFAKPFDTGAVANILINSVTVGLSLKVQESLGRAIPLKPEEMFADQQRFLYKAISGEIPKT